MARETNTTPTPHLFSDLFIPKGFKSNVLELIILQDLQAYFLELRILKGIGTEFERWNVARLNVTPLNPAGLNAARLNAERLNVKRLKVRSEREGTVIREDPEDADGGQSENKGFDTKEGGCVRQDRHRGNMERHD